MSIIFWIIGLGITSFTIIPIFIIFFFGIPTTKKLEKINMLKENNGIIKRYFFSILILFIIFLTSIMITFLFFKTGFGGFLGGAIISLFGLGKIGKNKNNIDDYIKVNERFFTADLDNIAIVIAK